MSVSSISLSIGQRDVSLPTPCVMGIINCSSRSFFQALPNISDALKKVEKMVDAGVSIIDIGAVATNPSVNMSSDLPSPADECSMLVPLISAITRRFDVLISVDTSEPVVMQAAISAGAHIINDQQALKQPGALEMAAALAVPICLMHSFFPLRMPGASSAEALLSQIKADLSQDIKRCLDAGIPANRIIIDPGFGGGNFGKSADENLYLLSHLEAFHTFELPVLVGLSRKSMLGDLLNLPVECRLNASVVAATVAAMKGAAIIRAHDVPETVQAMKIVQAL